MLDYATAAIPSVFFISNINGQPQWDEAAGFSFWLKGDGSSNVGALQFIYDEDYGARYEYAFPLKDTEWHQVTNFRWTSLVTTSVWNCSGVRLGDMLIAGVGTSLRQLGLQRLVDLLRLGAAELRAVFVARLAARPFRLGFGRPLGERTRLAFAGPAEFLDDSPQFGNFLTQLAATRTIGIGLLGLNSLAIHDGCKTNRDQTIALAPRDGKQVREPVTGGCSAVTHCQLRENGIQCDSRQEGKRMVSGHTGNVVPGNRLRVRISCPPLF